MWWEWSESAAQVMQREKEKDKYASQITLINYLISSCLMHKKIKIQLINHWNSVKFSNQGKIPIMHGWINKDPAVDSRQSTSAQKENKDFCHLMLEHVAYYKTRSRICSLIINDETDANVLLDTLWEASIINYGFNREISLPWITKFISGAAS